MRLTPPLAELQVVDDRRRNSAEQAAARLAAELRENKPQLDEHDFQLKHELGAVEVRRGPLSIVRVVFNFGDKGKARVFSEVLGEPGEWLRSKDFSDDNEAIAAFKNMLYEATIVFHKRRDEFRALGLI